MKTNRFFGSIFLTLLLATAGFAQIHVWGTNNPATDLPAVQAAVSNPYTTVYLHGTFNFGDDGSVFLSVPGITIQGVQGATIVGGTNPLWTLHPGEYPPDQTSGAKNLTIRNLRMEGWKGFAIYVIGVYAEDNFTLIENNTLIGTQDWSTNWVYGIHYCHSFGSAVIRNNLIRNVTWLAISTDGLLLHKNDSYRICRNRIEECHQDAISVGISDPFGLDPYLPVNEGPVIIEDNYIQISAEEMWPRWVWGIDLGGDMWLGTSNALVTRNTIVASNPANDGIFVPWYGHDRKIIGNNLSRLPSWSTQIADYGGQHDLISGNILGPIDFKTAQDMGDPYEATGVSLFSAQFYPGVYPDTGSTTNNIVIANDYRRTGRPGWKFDADGNLLDSGCVILASSVDLYGPDAPGYDVTKNAILEAGMFPRGTGGAKNQVLEVPPHAYGNFILGQAFNLNGQVAALHSTANRMQQGLNMKRAMLKKVVETCKKH